MVKLLIFSQDFLGYKVVYVEFDRSLPCDRVHHAVALLQSVADADLGSVEAVVSEICAEQKALNVHN